MHLWHMPHGVHSHLLYFPTFIKCRSLNRSLNSYVSVLPRAWTWVCKQANFSQKGSITLAPASKTAPPLQSSLHHCLLTWSWLCWGGAASPGGPIPSRLRVCPGVPMPSRLPVLPGGPMPSRLKYEFAREDPCPVNCLFALEDPCPVD